ncbi:MAG: peptidoglycan-associated lipoprotein Pal [Acidobacteriota bacterium]
MRKQFAYRRLAVLASLLLAAGLLTACAKKAPAAGGPGAGGSASPTPPPATWTPETSPPPSLQVEGGADAFNRQGVLKRVHFDTDKWEIRADARPILKENAAWLLAHPQFKVSVEGHCDERNTEAYNLALGERRANAVKEYLIGLGVPGDRIQTVSYGKGRPLCTDHDEACWQQNRRAEFLLMDAR